MTIGEMFKRARVVFLRIDPTDARTRKMDRTPQLPMYLYTYIYIILIHSISIHVILYDLLQIYHRVHKENPVTHGNFKFCFVFAHMSIPC